MHPETAMFFDVIARRVDRLLAALEGLEPAQLNWRPPAPNANSLYVLAAHTIANVEENLLGTLAGADTERDHEAEFAARGDDAAVLRQRWDNVRARCWEALDSVDAAGLGQTVEHPRRGQLSKREILLVVVRHAAEHEGQAQLTRDLLLATR